MKWPVIDLQAQLANHQISQTKISSRYGPAAGGKRSGPHTNSKEELI